MATAPSIGRAAPVPGAPAEATRDLYERFGGQIFAYCLVQLRSREEAEDAAQTTFMNAFRALERGVVPELESAWLYKIAQHVCLTRRRSWSRRRNVESPEDFERVQEVLGAPMRETDGARELTEALRALPDQQRRAILLREWQGLTYKEIAAEMDLSQAAVETLIFRSRRSLAQAIERLRASGDMNSIVAAIKSLIVGLGTKAVITIATVATTSVVAATPEARHQVFHFVDAVAQQVVAPTKPHRPLHQPPAAKVVRGTASSAIAKPSAGAQPAFILHDAAAALRAGGAPATKVTVPPAPNETATAPAPAPAAPAITGFTPQSGAPGTTVVIVGTGFTGATAVRFFGTSADYKVSSDTTIMTRVPAGATTGPITIVSPTAGDVTSSVSFVVTTASGSSSSPTSPKPGSGSTGGEASGNTAPAIAGFSPASAATGTFVKIGGHGFTGATAVRFYGTNADYVVNSDTSITARVPSGATSGPITIVSPTAGDITSSASFTVTSSTATTSAPASAPTVQGTSPTSGTAGTQVDIGGKNFTGATEVRFNGTRVDFTVSSDSLIITHVPSGATTGPITVVTPSGTASSGTFTVTSPGPPSISGFSPSSGPVGAKIGIGGSHFTGATSVKFNGIPASFTVGSDGIIQAVVPSGATTGTVTVTTPGGTAESATAFTVTH